MVKLYIEIGTTFKPWDFIIALSIICFHPDNLGADFPTSLWACIHTHIFIAPQEI